MKEGKQQSSHKRIKPGLLTEQEQVSKSVSSSQTAKGPGTIAHQQFESQSTEPLVLVPVRQLLYGKLFQHDLPTSLPIFSKLVKLKGQLLAPPPLLFSAMQHMKPQQAGCHVFQVCSQTEHEIFLKSLQFKGADSTDQLCKMARSFYSPTVQVSPPSLWIVGDSTAALSSKVKNLQARCHHNGLHGLTSLAAPASLWTSCRARARASEVVLHRGAVKVSAALRASGSSSPQKEMMEQFQEEATSASNERCGKRQLKLQKRILRQ